MPVLDELKSLDELADRESLEVARAETLDAIDDVLRTALEREDNPDLDEDEQRDHDMLVERHETIVQRLNELNRHDGTVERAKAQETRKRYAVPNINVIGTPPVAANRTLDELLFATPEVVRAGTVSSGVFSPNPYGAQNPVDALLYRSDAEQLVAPRLDEFLPEHQMQVERFQKLVTDMLIVGAVTTRDRQASMQECWEIGRSHPLLNSRWMTLMRAMDVDTAGEGSDWVPTGFGADLHREIRASGQIAPLFTRINLPTNPWKWPLEGADSTAYRVAEPTTDSETKMTASTPGTGGVTFDAEIFGSRTLFSRSLEADSVIAILNYVRGKLVQAHVDAEEKAILDGDTDGTHQDSDVGASTTDARTAWDGLRKKALAQTSTDHANATLSVAGLRTNRATMSRWGINPASIVNIVSVSSYYDLIADTEVTTVEKYGSQATILNGELGRVNGSPIIVSQHMREDLNASGVYDGVTTTRTYALTVRRSEWAMGQRMALEVEVDDSIYRETYQRVVVAFQRQDFQHIGTAAANDDTAILYNVA